MYLWVQLGSVVNKQAVSSKFVTVQLGYLARLVVSSVRRAACLFCAERFSVRSFLKPKTGK